MLRSASWLALALVLVCLACADRSEPPRQSGEAAAVEVLVKGSRFRGTNGIHFGPDGLLYVASVATPAIAAIDVASGEVVTQWGPDEGAKGPDDVAFGPDGSVYWTDILYGDVVRRAPDGTTAIVASPGPGVNPITLSGDGRLFVSQCFLGDKLFEIDPSGEREPRVIRDDLGPGCGLNGMDWGPDNRLYGPRWFQGSVVRVDVDSGALETVAEGFGVPAAVKFDSQGRLHVLDSLRGEIVRVELQTGAREVVGRVPEATADNLAFDDADRLFVSSFGDGFIVEVLGPDRNRTVLPGGVNMPGGLALREDAARQGGAPRPDEAGGERSAAVPVLYLADFFALRGLDPATGEETYAAHDIIGFSPLGSTMTVALDGANLVTTSWYDNAVKVWDPVAGEVVATFSDFRRPVYARPFQSDIVVSEWDTGSIVRLRRDAPDARTAIATGIATPAGLAANDDDLYVADRDSGRVLQIIAAGEVLSPAREIARDLVGPEGIELGDDGMLYVVEADGDRLSRIDPATGEVERLADGLALHVPGQADSPSTMLFNGLAVGADRIYVTGDLDNVIYAVARR